MATSTRPPFGTRLFKERNPSVSKPSNNRGMIELIALGLLAGLFFSTTFILNRMMSLEGGHWVWSAALRYAYMILLLIVGLSLWKRTGAVRAIFRLYLRHLTFWTLAGEIVVLNASLPNGLALIGMLLVFAGLGLFVRFQEDSG